MLWVRFRVRVWLAVAFAFRVGKVRFEGWRRFGLCWICWVRLWGEDVGGSVCGYVRFKVRLRLGFAIG